MTNEIVSQGSYVQIHKIVLKPFDRSQQVPVDTKNCAFEMFVKGFLLHDAFIGDTAKIQTITNREEEGTLISNSPSHKHNFGDFVPEMITMRKLIKEFMDGGE